MSAAIVRNASVLACFVALALPAPIFSAEVTPERLLHASEEPENWLMNLGDYSGSRYSALAQVNRENVHELVVLYSVALGGLVEGGGNYRAATPLSPLVADGFIYIVDGWGKVSKLDARRQGALVWDSDSGQNNLDAWLQASRGVALYRHWIISAGADGVLRWIDTDTGAITQSIKIDDPATGYTIAAPPLVVNDIILTAGGGADRTSPGQIDAIDARTGDHLWQTKASPRTGAAFLQSGLFDPDTQLTIWGAGNPVPLFDQRLPDEGGFTNSTVALELETGRLRWQFRYTPDDSHGFSEAGANHLAPRDRSASARKVLGHFGNDGYFYSLDAATGAFRTATPHVPGIEWTNGINPDTGRPVDPGPEPALWTNVPGCPNIRSIPAFASAYSLRTGLSYGAGADGCQPDMATGQTAAIPGWYGAYYVGAANAIGMLAAIDPTTGTMVSQRLMDFPLHSGVLATGGGLIFTTSAEGTLHALNDETLETVWSQKFASLSALPPISFMVDGEQFIAVVVGGNALSGELSYRPPELGMSESLFVLVVLGLPS